MFKIVGKQAIDGAKERISELLKGVDPKIINSELSKLAENIPVLGIFLKAYNAMTPEEQTEFVKDCLITGAKLGAKMP